jgi:hypothetical protein
MSIIDWQDDRSKEAAVSVKHSDEKLVYLIAHSDDLWNRRWIGELKLTKNPSGQSGVRLPSKTVLIELRNCIGGRDVLIKIYDQVSRRRSDNGNRLVHVSMNGSLHLSEHDLAEMNMAIEEAVSVYRHPAHWIELNAKN